MLSKTPMLFMRWACCAGLLATFSSANFVSVAFAQTSAEKYPDHPIRLIIPFAPGASNDIMGREIASGLAMAFGKSVVPQNEDGAAGVIGIADVAHAQPDGYTIGMGTASTLAVSPAMRNDLPYKLSDFAAVTELAYVTHILIIGKARDFNSVNDLIAYAKVHPGDLTFGSAGIGTANDLAADLFASMAGIKLTDVPYKGTAPSIIDLLGGRINMTFAPLLVAGPLIKDGSVKPLGVTSLERMPAMPSLPTIAEVANLPEYDVSNWYGIIAPAGTPQPVIDKLNKAIVQIMNDPKIRKELEDQGLTIVADSSAHFAATLTSEATKFREAVRAAHLVE